MFCRCFLASLKVLGCYLAVLLCSASTFASDALHQPFDDMLRAYVVDGQVNYEGFSKDSRFNQYLGTIANTPVDKLNSREQQLAFWINAYNALSIKGIVDGKSPKSLLGRYRFFISTKYQVAGQSISLDHLEKKIIIPYKEPRIHFAIVCASASCPKLISQAYSAKNIDQQLNDNATDFLNDPDKNIFDASKKTIRLSKIFKWFKEEFVAEAGSLQEYIAPFIQDSQVAEKLKQQNFKVKYLKYRWTLNGTAPVK